MTLKELNFFYKLCENSIVSQVAKELNISQSAVSIAIKSLEIKLGEELFNRIGKKLILNERGRYFKDLSYEHFISLLDAQTVFKKEKIAGNLKIAASKTIANHLMPNIYYNFLCKYKNITLDIDSLNSKIIIEKILNGTLDIGLIETQCDEINIIKEKILDNELIIVTSDEKALKKAYIDSIKKKWILREIGSGIRDTFVKHLGAIIDDIDIFMSLHDFEEIKQIVLKYKETITAIPKMSVEKELEEKRLFEIELINIDFKREFYLIYNKNKTFNKLFKLFKEYIKIGSRLAIW